VTSKMQVGSTTAMEEVVIVLSLKQNIFFVEITERQSLCDGVHEELWSPYASTPHLRSRAVWHSSRFGIPSAISSTSMTRQLSKTRSK
jgi:hypothetical protein